MFLILKLRPVFSIYRNTMSVNLFNLIKLYICKRGIVLMYVIALYEARFKLVFPSFQLRVTHHRDYACVCISIHTNGFSLLHVGWVQTMCHSGKCMGASARIPARISWFRCIESSSSILASMHHDFFLLCTNQKECINF